MNIRRYFPSSRFALFIGSFALVGILIAGAIYIGRGGTWTTGDVSLSVGFPSSRAAEVGDTDTDGDGLKDWEEGVRGTDAKKADTDGDGTSDGAEVLAVRDPRKAGPDDSLSRDADQKFIAELVAAASSSNLTDSISKTVFANYVGARGEGTSGDTQTQQAIIDHALQSTEVPLRGVIYTKAAVKTSGDDNASIRAFANASMAAVKLHPDASFDNAMSALQAAVDLNDPVAPRAMRAIGREYRLMAADMARVPIPPAYLDAYLIAINAIDNAGASFEDIATIQEDPVRAVAGLRNYTTLTNGAASALILIARQINAAQITFASNEPGSDWLALLAYST